MNRRVFEAALRATAKITFGTTLVGCGGTVSIQEQSEETEPGEVAVAPPGDPAPPSPPGPPAAPPTTPGDPPDPARTPPDDPPPDDPAVCQAPTDDWEGWATFNQELFDCCVDALVTTVPDDPEAAWFNELPDQATMNCCTQLLEPNYSAVWQGEPLPEPMPDNVLAACCVAKHGHIGCIPWGPPMPPSMELEVLFRWRTHIDVANDVRGVA